MKFENSWKSALVVLASGLTLAANANGFTPLTGADAMLVTNRVEAHGDHCGGNHDVTVPVETNLHFSSTPSIGQSATLSFELVSGIDTDSATVSFSSPNLKITGGDPKQNGKLQDKKTYKFDLGVMVPGEGDYTVTANLKASAKWGQIGKEKTLYIHADSKGVTVSEKDPNAPKFEWKDVVPAVKADPSKVINNPSDSRGKPLVPEINVDGGRNTQANTTVTGHIYYELSSGGSLAGSYGAAVYCYRTSDNAFLGNTAVNGDGSFSLVINPGGNQACYFTWRSANYGLQITNYGGSEYIIGNVGFTAGAGGTVDVGGWKPGSYDSSRAFRVCDYITTAWAQSYYGLGHDPIYCRTNWQNGGTDGTYWNGQIHLQDADFKSPDVVMHEYGHHHMNSVFAGDYPPGSGGSHWFTNHYNVRLAWSEGYATYYEMSAQGWDKWYDDTNPSNFIHFDCEINYDGNQWNGNINNNGNGYDTESAVLSLMRDIGDSNNDGAGDLFDWTSFGGGIAYDIMRNYKPGGHTPYDIQEWFNGWHARGWGAKPQINGQMMVHGMTQNRDSYPILGLYDGVNRYTGTWFWDGYGRGSYTAKNYGSQTQGVNALWVWLRGPAFEDYVGGSQIGAEVPTGNVIAARNTWAVWQSTNHVFPNFTQHLTGNYNIDSGWYNGAGVWRGLIDTAESGTASRITTPVVLDTDAPDYCTVTDDGLCQNSKTSIHFSATADDYDSGIYGYWTRVGTSQGSGNIQDWVWNPQVSGNYVLNATTFEQTITGLTLPANQKVYVTVVARNVEGYDKFGYSDGIFCWDATAPVNMSATDDGVSTGNGTQLHVTAHGEEPDGCIVAWWSQIVDTTTGTTVAGYARVATGSLNDWNYIRTGLSLVNNHVYRIDVACENMSSSSGYSPYGYASTDGIRYLTPVNVTGKVVLPFRSGASPWDYTSRGNIWVGYGPQASTTIEQWDYLFPDAAGNFVSQCTIFGAKRAVVATYHSLWKKKNVNISSTTGANIGTYSLLPGDTDLDNVVTIFDYIRISDAFDKSYGDAGYDYYADIDEDGVISIFDYILMSDHFDEAGDF